MTKMNCAELTEKANAQADIIEGLVRDVKVLQSTSPVSISAEIEQLRSEYDNKLNIIMEGYEAKIAGLEKEINIVMKTRSETTLGCIKKWIRSLDEKIDKMTIELDIVKNNGINQEEYIKSIVGADKLNAEPRVRLDDIHTMVSVNKTAIAELQCIADRIPNIATRFVKNTNSSTIDTRARNEVLIQRGEPSLLNANATHHMQTQPTTSVFGDGGLTLEHLENRIDMLEDYSRRDNLLFFGFDEEKNEDCFEKVHKLICNKIMPNNNDLSNIRYVRVHRLGKFKSGNKRPIIARFSDYSWKTAVLKSRRNLAGTKFLITEDFCINTNNTRKHLEECAKTISIKKEDEIDGAYVRFKSLVVKDTSGQSRTYSKNFVDSKRRQHPNDWWDHLSNTNRATINSKDVGSGDNVSKEIGITAVSDHGVLSDSQHLESSVEPLERVDEAANENFEDAVEAPTEGPAITTTDEASKP